MALLLYLSVLLHLSLPVLSLRPEPILLNLAKITSIHEPDAANSAWKNSEMGAVYLEDDKYVFRAGPPSQKAVAYGSFSDAEVHPSYFGQLRVATSGDFEDNQQMFAAGYLEGYLTHSRIDDHFNNALTWVGKQTTEMPVLIEWMKAQDAWAHEMAKQESSTFWKQTGSILSQFDGLVAGYSAATSGQDGAKTREDFMAVNGLGDFLDLMPALDPTSRPDWQAMDATQMDNFIASQGHCSALIKVAGDLSELYFAHSSWFIYQGMNRIYKHYNFSLHEESTSAHRTSFSSYPGVLSSLDDFYISDSGLVMTQTTNSVLNYSLFDLVTPKSLLAWQRVRVANQMAKTGKEWADIIDTYNSGTYNNQYMVLDLKLFKPGEALSPGLLWVVEQIPGLVARADKTQILERGYWPSYNVPFFREVYDKSGYKEVISQHSTRGELFATALTGLSYQLAPRAKIFRRDSGSVDGIESLKKIMRYNGWPEDPYSGGSPNGAICSRGDLTPNRGSTNGCYDTKVSSYTWALEMRAEAINGPTTEGQVPFSWTKFENIAHQGLPEVFDFVFEPQIPSWDNWFVFMNQHLKQNA